MLKTGEVRVDRGKIFGKTILVDWLEHHLQYLSISLAAVITVRTMRGDTVDRLLQSYVCGIDTFCWR